MYRLCDIQKYRLKINKEEDELTLQIFLHSLNPGLKENNRKKFLITQNKTGSIKRPIVIYIFIYFFPS